MDNGQLVISNNQLITGKKKQGIGLVHGAAKQRYGVMQNLF
jgi:hypothetical protein